MHWLGILFLTALLAMAPGYGRAQSAGEKSALPAAQPKGTVEKGTPAQAAKSYTPKERQAYQQKVAADLDKLQQKIEALPENYTTARPQMKRTILKVWHGVKKKLYVAQNQLAALKKAPEKDWSARKDETDKAMAELNQAYKEAEARLE